MTEHETKRFALAQLQAQVGQTFLVRTRTDEAAGEKKEGSGREHRLRRSGEMEQSGGTGQGRSGCAEDYVLSLRIVSLSSARGASSFGSMRSN